ncbi:hypothetical protein [Oceaniradius stylonematis]|uniref:hypothetical protein n=1 Tax=Oceaniradius stylonematis TaxID=2184161 RepID=UPI003B58E7CA
MADAATKKKLAEADMAVEAMREGGVDPMHVEAVKRLIRAHRGMAQTCSALWRDNRALRDRIAGRGQKPIPDAWEEREAHHG